MLRLNTIRKKKKPLLTPLNINKHIKQAFSPSLSGQNQCVALVIYIIALLLKIKERVTQSKLLLKTMGSQVYSVIKAWVQLVKQKINQTK